MRNKNKGKQRVYLARYLPPGFKVLRPVRVVCWQEGCLFVASAHHLGVVFQPMKAVREEALKELGKLVVEQLQCYVKYPDQISNDRARSSFEMLNRAICAV